MACTRSSCRCNRYKQPTSKWSKGRCDSCNHPKIEHKFTNIDSVGRITSKSVITPLKHNAYEYKQSTSKPCTPPIIRASTTTYSTSTSSAFVIGDKISVLYENQWWNAEIINISTNQVEITYEDWYDSNEWINKTSKRLSVNRTHSKSNIFTQQTKPAIDHQYKSTSGASKIAAIKAQLNNANNNKMIKYPIIIPKQQSETACNNINTPQTNRNYNIQNKSTSGISNIAAIQAQLNNENNNKTIKKPIEIPKRSVSRRWTATTYSQTNAPQTQLTIIRSQSKSISGTSKIAALKAKLKNANNTSKTMKKQIELHKKSVSSGDCALCADTKSNIITLSKCGHNLCKDCLRNYIMITVSNKLNIKCPFCQEILDQHKDVKSVLSHKEFAEMYLTPNLKQCLSSNCDNTVQLFGSSSARLDCNKCGRSWCIQCKVSWHENMDCETYKQHDVNEQKTLELLDSENQEGLTKTCPNCDEYVEKNGGCMHMTCRCGAHWCWMCGTQQPEETVYNHIGKCPKKGDYYKH